MFEVSKAKTKKKTMSKTKFSLYFLAFFICVAIVFQIYKDMDDNLVSFIIYTAFTLILYSLFARVILNYGRSKNFSKNDFIIVYVLLFLALLFPLIFLLITWIVCLIKDDIFFTQTKDTIKMAFYFGLGILALFFLSMYPYGGYKLIVDDKYTKLQLVAGIFIPPYTIYVGISEVFESDKIIIK